MKTRAKRWYRHSSPALAACMRWYYFKRLMTQVEIARAFQLSQGTVSKTLSEQTWTPTV